MSYQKTIDFLYSKLPMFTRVGASALKKDLHNTIALCEALGNPQHCFKSIHVAGTNGKGSTSHMLAAILQQAGYKTGLYTSPHLKDFRERIKINGKMVPKSFVVDFVKSQKETITALEPSFFEVTVAMAFEYFANEKVDIAIIEVGLGGKLDSTNIITPLLSVITNISFDHTNILGNSLNEIAEQKAGIIKKNIPVVVGEKQQETENVFVDQAKAVDAPIEFANEQFTITESRQNHGNLQLDVIHSSGLRFEKLLLDLTGTYQLKNVLTVLASILQIRTMGFEVEDADIYTALQQVKKLTGLAGRWQTLQFKPRVICDTGHNKAGILEVLSNINSTPYKHLHLVIGMVKDKDIDAILALLPKSAAYYFCSPNLERAIPAEELSLQAKSFQLHGKSYDSVQEALDAAKHTADEDDLIFVGGSTFVVAEIL